MKRTSEENRNPKRIRIERLSTTASNFSEILHNAKEQVQYIAIRAFCEALCSAFQKMGISAHNNNNDKAL